MPAEVRVAALLVAEWCKDESKRMRAEFQSGPRRMLIEMVAAVLEYFLAKA